MTHEALAPGGTIGILGGGQLGRMLSVAASRLGLRTHIFEPGSAPAADVAAAVTTASYEDAAALKAFAASVDLVTFEFENVPTAALDIIESQRPIYPGREALRVSQDRLTEKDFLQELGLKTAPYQPVDTIDDLRRALADIGTPAILKTRRFGYDGKGQVRVSAADVADQAFAELAGAPGILERICRLFARSLCYCGARTRWGRRRVRPGRERTCRRYPAQNNSAGTIDRRPEI